MEEVSPLLIPEKRVPAIIAGAKAVQLIHCIFITVPPGLALYDCSPLIDDLFTRSRANSFCTWTIDSGGRIAQALLPGVPQGHTLIANWWPAMHR